MPRTTALLNVLAVVRIAQANSVTLLLDGICPAKNSSIWQALAELSGEKTFELYFAQAARLNGMQNRLAEQTTSRCSRSNECTGRHAIPERKLQCLKEKAFMIFSKMLSAGNKFLDSEYMKLHDIIDRIVLTIVARDVATLSETFDLLERCLCACFLLEKNIAQLVDFDFSQHRLLHQRLLNNYLQVKAELVSKNGGWLEWEVKYYIDSLRDYLIQYINDDIRPLSTVLSRHLYELSGEKIGTIGGL